MALQAPYNSLSPVSGNNYVVNNYATLHVLEDFGASLVDGTPIIATEAGTNDISQIVRVVSTFPFTPLWSKVIRIQY